MAYYSKQSAKQQDNNKPYTSRVWMMRAIDKDKEGNDRVNSVLISFGNYWFINCSKSGKVYGRITISGDYNTGKLNKEFGALPATERGTPVTLFFSDRDAEYLDGLGVERCNKSFVANVYVKDGELCASVRKLF